MPPHGDGSLERHQSTHLISSDIHCRLMQKATIWSTNARRFANPPDLDPVNQTQIARSCAERGNDV